MRIFSREINFLPNVETAVACLSHCKQFSYKSTSLPAVASLISDPYRRFNHHQYLLSYLSLSANIVSVSRAQAHILLRHTIEIRVLLLMINNVRRVAYAAVLFLFDINPSESEQRGIDSERKPVIKIHTHTYIGRYIVA